MPTLSNTVAPQREQYWRLPRSRRVTAREPRNPWGTFAVYALLLVLASPFATPGQSNPGGGAKAAVTLPGGGIQLRVECGNSKAALHSIGAALKLVVNPVPTTLLISGTCYENVAIQGLNNVTLQGNPAATIEGGSDPNINTVGIVGSLNIALNNLTIIGGGQGVVCAGVSYCQLLRVTIENSLGDGANVQAGARLEITDSAIQNNAGSGFAIAGVGAFFGGSITGNGSDGVTLRNGGFFGATPGDASPNVTIQNNGGFGIQASLHNTINLNSAVITGNAGDGITLQMGSAMVMIASSVTSNSGHQVRIGHLSVARFAGGPSNTVTGANSPDVVCDPQFSATRQLSNAPGASTNCPAELPPTP